jgi:hypothetical protein
MFITTAAFLPQHHTQRQATSQIITALETSNDAGEGEPAADAS